ncbi:hypothetical protein GUITHDRAFT_155450 [Guillardia theta CCMP2712]|uniref:Uncharacterized protein n=2 Tax=Guillardia theta TaxID=55529 RepID=L1IHY8_GUITC|nr:hypothetical protein GUITHDRAFT_155450 [Guillardia theta CCMP2712]EKX35559.1 hypothetical protein GUITHDRAFT_155450 [Guillardia theta CCMP2712]|eukprot:XP_005822539.1 hypothetical protein GUITHDRAFT_155450 [Guillardia theta CCMP2712]
MTPCAVGLGESVQHSLCLRGGSIAQLAGLKETKKMVEEEKIVLDPKEKREMLAKVPKIDHKDEYQKFKSKVILLDPMELLVSVKDRFCGAFVNLRDFVLDNTGNLIYKALPFTIAILHLPFFKGVTEGTPAFE